MLWSPTIRASLIARTPRLDVFCPGCGTSRAIDLRTVDRHPLASVGTLVLGLRFNPMAKLTDEQRRALRLLARRPDGCARVVLLGYGLKLSMLTAAPHRALCRIRVVGLADP
jgi:hypothetical protein